MQAWGVVYNTDDGGGVIFLFGGVGEGVREGGGRCNRRLSNTVLTVIVPKLNVIMIRTKNRGENFCLHFSYFYFDLISE